MITLRAFVAGGSVAALSACATPPPTTSSREVEREAEIFPPLPAHYGAITDEPYPIPAVPEGVVPPRLWRRKVENPFSLEVPGTIVVDPNAGFLHLSLSP
jgi:hypothetical protein